ncbi:DMT family transporter [Ulvibacter antarcticus]|uniref:EamA domain-containing membrane protein RarD n=1 Tax=Ulvibacter antarcticus TaxID=442714 RepID=A0A3L9Z159_9FLAO|nr:EamA family transporter [Ulvibacter antarcticus]RMA65757.1 EamA domain-containing membrane protein RarD [Ulvibacter antarcticus]
MKGIPKKWIYLIVLSIVWGSSFILIKKSLVGLTPLQLGSLRVLFAAIFLLIAGYSKLKTIQKKDWKWIIISALLGTFIPVFLFAFAETEIDSAIASILNSTTPIMALIAGALVFSIGFTRNQFVGVIVGLFGSLLLIWSGSNLNPDQNYWYAGLVLIASICYAFNVNIIKRHLQNIPALTIAVGNFVVLIIPAILVLIFSDFFSEALITDRSIHISIGYLTILALVGTGVAKVMFNKLVQLSTPVFSTSVTYLIPIVALLWGVLDGEKFTIIQLGAGGIILLGVLLSNKS